MITVDRLTKQFGRIRAVQEVSFQAERGEVLGLLGPNGSGKTTIMRTLAGFFPPTAGAVWVAGVNVLDDPVAARRCTGYLPESSVLYPDMRVDEFLGFCADVRRLRGRRRVARLDQVKRVCGLSEVGRRLIGKLSRGFRQRVGLAQALIHEPEVLILDEPTVGLDPEQVIEIRALIESLRGRVTVLLSTHILPEVSTVCDRVVIIDRGRLIAQDTAEGLARSLQQGESTFVCIDGPSPEIGAELRGISGVEHVEPQPGRRHACFVLQTRNGEATRAAVAAATVARGWGLIEMRPIVMTLEELFVHLVRDRRDGSPA